MKIVKPNAELMFAPNNDDLFALKHLESVGRTCYKSENNITDDSCINFVSGIIKRGHEAVIEHYSFIYELNDVSLDSLEFLIKNLSYNGFNSYLRITYDKRPVVSGNVRAWRELFKWAAKLGYRIPGYMKSFVYAYPLFFPEYKDSLFSTEVDEDYVFTPLSVAGLHGDIELLAHVDITARLTNDRGVSHEEVRHRPASFAQESTRYCNYSKDKFDNTISYIDLLGGMELDSKVKGMSANEKSAIYDEWVSACEDAERHYFKMLELGATPQIARSVLNNSTKTEICITMNLAEWRHFFTLRLSSAAHPQMREVASMLLDRFDTEFPQYHKYVGVSE